LPVPAEQGFRLDDQQRLAPSPEATGEQHQERPSGRRAARARGAAPQDAELVAEEGVLGHEGGPTVHEVGERARHNTLFGGFRRGVQAWPARANKGAAELSTAAEQARQHGALLVE